MAPTPTPTPDPLAQAQADLAAAREQVVNLTAAVQGLIAQRNKAQSERDNFEVQVQIDQAQIAALKKELPKK